MLRSLLHGWALLGFAVTVVVGLAGHNLLQAWGARLLGDRGPVREGYGRLGRIQLDPLGTVTAVLTAGAWGWAAPVPMDVRFRKQRARAAAALLLGPAYLFGLTVGVEAVVVHAHLDPRLLEAFLAALSCSAGLLIVSLAPFPPLALGRALWLYAPTTPKWQRAKYSVQEESLGSLIAFGFLMLPLMFTGLPDAVGRLVPHVIAGISHLVA